LKARVAAQIVPFWFDFEKDQFKVSLRKCLLQLSKSLNPLTQGVVNNAT